MTTARSYGDECEWRSTAAGASVGSQRRSQMFFNGRVRLLMRCWCLVAAACSWRSVAADPAEFDSVTTVPGALQCPHFDAVANYLYFCDSDAGTINRFSADDEELTSAVIKDSVALSFVIPLSQSSSNNTFAVGIAGSIGIFQWDGTSNTTLTAQSMIPVVQEPNAITFGKADPNGLLFVSTSAGEICSVGPDHKVERVLSHICRPDGFTWSATDPYFYYVERESSTLIAHKYESGAIVANDSFTAYDFKANNIPGEPRTVIFDAAGKLWVSFSTSNLLLQLDVAQKPNITSSKQLELPDIGVNYFTFGGPNDVLNEIFMTTSSSGKDEGSGTLLRVINAGADGLEDRPVNLQPCTNYGIP